MAHSTGKTNSQDPSTNIWIAAMPVAFVFLWSTGFIGAKYGIPYAEPFTFLSIRFTVVIGLMPLVCLVTKAPWPKSVKATIHIVIAGTLVNRVYLGGVFSSVKVGFPVGISALVTGSQPILTAILARHVLGETVTKRQWVGIFIGFIGVALVVSSKVAGAQSNLIGLGLSIIALLGITTGMLYQKKYCNNMNLRSGSVIQFSSSLIIALPLAFLFETMVIQRTVQFISSILWLVIVLSVGAITLLSVLICQGTASKVASLFYLVPPATALMPFFIFDEVLGPIEFVGMAAVVGGVALVTLE
jgi:drug/metabolite transporter (DMT)-like permease